MKQRIFGSFGYIKNPKNPAEILMIIRKNNPYANTLSLTGGAQEEGESLSDTVVREVKEETNAEVEVLKIIGHVDFVGDHDSSRLYRAHVFECRYVGGDFRAGPEVSEVRWVKEETIPYLNVALPVRSFYERMKIDNSGYVIAELG